MIIEIKVPYIGYIKINAGLNIGYKNKLEKEVAKLLKKEYKIKAIKTYMEKTGKELKESKWAVDEIQEKYNL